MESASTASIAFAGPSSEVTTPAAYEEGHHFKTTFAITASQVPKPAGGIATPSQAIQPIAATDLATKDVKSFGTRFSRGLP